MFRIIRFRIWDKIRNKMYRHDDLPDILDLSNIRTTLQNIFNLSTMQRTDFAIMQYTGLKDTCDKEIYEGDILEETIGIDEKTRYKVEWGNDGWFLINMDVYGWNIDEAMKLDPECQPRMSYFYKDMKIVGNVFENTLT